MDTLGDLKGKVVKVEGQANTFTCESGFGCSPKTNGSKIFGKWSNGESGVIRREFVESIV